MLTPQHQLESLSRSYVKAIVGHCGLTCGFRAFNYGIDVTIHQVTTHTNRRTKRKRYIESGACLDVQIKTTTRAIVQTDCIIYGLDVQTYNDLRDPNVCTPRILVLHVVPQRHQMQLRQTEVRLCLGGCSYWRSFKGSRPTSNKHKIRVRISRRNVFCEDAVNEIMQRIRDGGDP